MLVVVLLKKYFKFFQQLHTEKKKNKKAIIIKHDVYNFAADNKNKKLFANALTKLIFVEKISTKKKKTYKINAKKC